MFKIISLLYVLLRLQTILQINFLHKGHCAIVILKLENDFLFQILFKIEVCPSAKCLGVFSVKQKKMLEDEIVSIHFITLVCENSFCLNIFLGVSYKKKILCNNDDN